VATGLYARTVGRAPLPALCLGEARADRHVAQALAELLMDGSFMVNLLRTVWCTAIVCVTMCTWHAPAFTVLGDP
jgi:hypothetical protein